MYVFFQKIISTQCENCAASGNGFKSKAVRRSENLEMGGGASNNVVGIIPPD